MMMPGLWLSSAELSNELLLQVIERDFSIASACSRSLNF